MKNSKNSNEEIQAKFTTMEECNKRLEKLICILKNKANIDWKLVGKLYNKFIKPITNNCNILKKLIKENEVKTRSPKNDLINEKLDLILNGVHSLDARVAKVEVDMNVVKGDMVEVKGDINILKTDMNVVKGDINILKTDMVEVKGDIGVLKTDMETVKSSINRLEKGFGNLKSHFGIDFLKNK